MKFTHRFTVVAPVERVAEFHSRASSMAAITPPPLIARIHNAPERLGSGDVMDFTLWAGPVPIRWTAKIEDATIAGFTDRQLAGPFASWAHRHNFCPVGSSTTEVIDEIEATIRPHILWGPVGVLMWIGMPLLFAFRGWRTKRLLERGT